MVKYISDYYNRFFSGLLQVEEARELFTGGKTFSWPSFNVTREMMWEAFVESTWALLLASREERITSTLDHFALKQYLIEHIASRKQ